MLIVPHFLFVVISLPFCFPIITKLVISAVIVGEVANFAAYAFAPAILVTPLGALSIIIRYPIRILPKFNVYFFFCVPLLVDFL
jgi:Magnesium transporter NIPA